MKVCSKCKQVKSLAGFGKDASTKDKLKKHCKDCRKVEREKRQAKSPDYNINWRKLNKEKVKAYEGRADVKARKNAYAKAKRKTDSLFKFAYTVRIHVNRALKKHKNRRCLDYLGCTIAQLQEHLAKQFLPGMSLENHGEWHIDHIVPIASAKTQQDLERLCHYTNLQPLWAKDNLSKGNRLK